MKKKIRIVLEQDKCIGCGTCALICPKFFEMKDGLAYLKNSQKNKEGDRELLTDAGEGDLLCLERAAKSCSTRIIKIEKISRMLR